MNDDNIGVNITIYIWSKVSMTSNSRDLEYKELNILGFFVNISNPD